MAVWMGLNDQRARRIVRLSDSLEHAFIRCLSESRGYLALSTPGVSESPAATGQHDGHQTGRCL
jgi:hypothetical protein